ncbi:HAD family hydrolase [Cognatishimia sp. MH4019]|uniref:HAD family hydrolase n=1 Tax=Cognatishimia sp. MH4019 TaxID=2854030 RepID=UPI001CD723C6|nr:HAD family hydrolase [Cognatishimia sp. MH4019]
MIVFDMDDTLYLERDFAFSGYEFLEQWVVNKTGQSGFGDACKQLFLKGERRQVFDRASEMLGIEATPDLITQLVEQYRTHPPQITLAPDAARFLARAKGPFGLISDGPAYMQRNKSHALGLDTMITHVCLTGDWPDGHGKPHPRAFQEMEGHSPTPAQMIYIADNPAKDFLTPNARGWHTIQITREGGVHDPNPETSAHAAQRMIAFFDELEDWPV